MELLPCPFCGGRAKHWIRPGDGTHECVCISCRMNTGDCHSEEYAVQQWNTRVSQESAVKELVKESGWEPCFEWKIVNEDMRRGIVPGGYLYQLRGSNSEQLVFVPYKHELEE